MQVVRKKALSVQSWLALFVEVGSLVEVCSSVVGGLSRGGLWLKVNVYLEFAIFCVETD